MMDEEIRKAIEVLKNGGTILYPTDTVWGIGCDATNKEAVEKVFRIKQRDESKSLIVLVDNDQKLNKHLADVPEMAWDLIEFSDKPITIIYPGARGLAPNAIAEDGSIAIRLTKDEFCRKLIGRFNKPIISTSANISGEPTPGSFSEISAAILKSVDHIVNWRQNEKNNPPPSSIIKLQMNGEIQIIRK
jgi:L-threonylcarbamoyladenylate synthase